MFRKKKLNLEEISAIMPPDLDAFVAKIEREFSDIYDTFRTGFTTTRKGIFVPHRKNKIVEIYDLFFENKGTTKFAMWKLDEDEFCEKIRTCAAKLEFYNEQDDILSEFRIFTFFVSEKYVIAESKERTAKNKKTFDIVFPRNFSIKRPAI
jgi:hypothetical protein